jgi:hypothetical protein
MPEVQEVFRLATQKVKPDPGALERQYRDQRSRVTRKKTGVYALVAALVVAAVLIGISALPRDDRRPASQPTATPIPLVTGGALEPGTYVVRTLDPAFDASHRITIDVPDGYEGSEEGFAVLRLGRTGQMAVSAWVVGDVYADPCRWSSTRLDPSPVSSVDALVAALASQRGVRASTPTDVTVDGFAGKYMERTVSAGINLGECDGAEFRPWVGSDAGARFVEPGQRDLLWIVDVDGVPLVIDASLGGPGASAQDRAEHIQIAESVRIDPR